jgi:hypothetical protein
MGEERPPNTEELRAAVGQVQPAMSPAAQEKMVEILRGQREALAKCEVKSSQRRRKMKKPKPKMDVKDANLSELVTRCTELSKELQAVTKELKKSRLAAGHAARVLYLKAALSAVAAASMKTTTRAVDGVVGLLKKPKEALV